MKPRPTSITVISWILIGTGAISLITSTWALTRPITKELMARNPLPLPVQYAMLYVGLVVTITSGFAMLRGHNWGRLLYVIWSGVGFVIGLAFFTMKMGMIPGIVFYVVIVLFLFRPKANQFFAGNGMPDVPQNS
jgi:hypothetical protein